MAMASEVRSAAVGTPGVTSRILRGLVARYSAYVVYSKCVAELSALSDRQLSDLGLHRSMIRSLAREEAYGRQ